MGFGRDFYLVQSKSRGGAISTIAGGGGIDSPNDISNLVLWFDANAGVTLGTGNNVTVWTNQKTGSTNQARNTNNDSRNPQKVTDGGGTAIQFITANQTSFELDTGLALAANPRTVAGVFRRPSGALETIGFSAGLSTGFEWYSDGVMYTCSATKTMRATNAQTDTASYHAIICTCNGVDVFDMYFDNATPLAKNAAGGSGQGSDWTYIGYGDGTYGNGYMKQLCVFDKVLDSTEISDLMDWLLTKLA